MLAARPHPLVDLCTGLNDVVPFKFADLADVLLRRHGLQIIDEAGVDVAVEVHILGLVRGALRRVVLGDPEPCVASGKLRVVLCLSPRRGDGVKRRRVATVTPSMRRLAVTEELNSLRTLERSVEVLGVKHVADVHGDVLAQDASDRCVRLCEKG